MVRKHQEVSLKSNTAGSVSGVSDQLSNNGIPPSFREGQENTTRSSKSAQVLVNISTTPSYLYRESCSNFQSCNAGPFTLQSITESTQFYDHWEQPLEVSDKFDAQLVLDKEMTSNGGRPWTSRQ